MKIPGHSSQDQSASNPQSLSPGSSKIYALNSYGNNATNKVLLDKNEEVVKFSLSLETAQRKVSGRR